MPEINAVGEPYVQLLERLRKHIDFDGYDGFGPDALHISAANAIDELIVGLASEIAISNDLRSRLADAEAKLNTPELADFASGVVSEAGHQRNRWGSDHDAGKAPEDWFWLVGYLGGKALRAHASGDVVKALHHTISTAAVLANWHASILGLTNMRPGIDPAERGIEPEAEKTSIEQRRAG